MLQALKAVEWRIRLHAHALDARVQLLQPPRRAYKCSARAQARHKVRYLPVGLLPDLVRRPRVIRRSAIVRFPVLVVSVLVGVVEPCGVLRQLASLADRYIRTIV